ncbi:MAG TPA: hypothetical protein VN375_17615 [Vicinamibacteria bacterium]|nr:hypothetical protein [Vicinamibacteria bacterium]
MTRSIVLAGILVAGVVGAEERTTGHETNYRIAATRCSVSKRCWPDRALAPCGQADKLKGLSGGTAKTGLYQNDLDQCLNAAEKADCSKIQIDLIRFMNDDANAACHGYSDYSHQRGRYVAAKK